MGARKKLALEQFNRDNILTAARELFETKGVQDTTMDDIALQADYSKSTISGGGNCGLALAAGDDFDAAMVDRHAPRSFLRVYPPFPFVPAGAKRRLQDRTIPRLCGI